MNAGLFVYTAILATTLTCTAVQASPVTYQKVAITESNLPVFYPQLKKQMTYQSSWLAGKYNDFALWKSDTRKILRQALLTPTQQLLSPQKRSINKNVVAILLKR